MHACAKIPNEKLCECQKIKHKCNVRSSKFYSGPLGSLLAKDGRNCTKLGEYLAKIYYFLGRGGNDEVDTDRATEHNATLG